MLEQQILNHDVADLAKLPIISALAILVQPCRTHRSEGGSSKSQMHKKATVELISSTYLVRTVASHKDSHHIPTLKNEFARDAIRRRDD